MQYTNENIQNKYIMKNALLVTSLNDVKKRLSPNENITVYMLISDFEKLSAKMLDEFGTFNVALLVKSKKSSKEVQESTELKFGQLFVEVKLKCAYEINTINVMQAKLQAPYPAQTKRKYSISRQAYDAIYNIIAKEMFIAKDVGCRFDIDKQYILRSDLSLDNKNILSIINSMENHFDLTIEVNIKEVLTTKDLYDLIKCTL